MTKTITENSGILVKAGAVVGVAPLLGVWFNTRLSAVETGQAETKKDVQYLGDNVREIKGDLKEVLRRLPPTP
jgi:hypothetical protein